MPQLPGAGFPFKGRFVQVDGVRLHYVDEGRGDPVLMLHGQPTWSYLWRNVIPPVASFRRVIAPDMMGFGLSGKPPDGDYSFAGHTRRLEALIDALELRRLTLALHDWGGPIGVDYAVRHPDNIAALVLVNTFAGVGFGAPWWFRLATRSPLIGDILVRRLNLFGRFAVSRGTKRRVDPEILRNYRERHPDRASRHGVAAFPKMLPLRPADAAWDAMREARSRLTAMETPTLFIAGADDPVTRWVDPRPLVDAMPNARLAVVADSGHFIQEDRPEELARLIVKFLVEIGPRRAGAVSAAPPASTEAADA